MIADRPFKPAEFTEKKLIESILDGSYPIGTNLPSERTLAQTLGVTRPTLREVLQRLSKEGWVLIRHGKPTRVNDYLSQGGLGILRAMARYGHHLSDEMISNLMGVRIALMPEIAVLAAENDPLSMRVHLMQAARLQEDPGDFARFDWELQLIMGNATGNPVFNMILNDFTPLYEKLGQYFYQTPEARQFSLAYYRDLDHLLAEDIPGIRQRVRAAMEDAVSIWHDTIRKMEKP